ncbi:MAG: UvrB/UvrC motif-containing protein [Planctomycetota bacterium]
MASDITSLLEGWDFKPDEITVRSITGEDGKEKLQLRIDLGLMQLEIDGRPDGKQIHGFESCLEWHRHQQEEHDSANPDGAPYALDSEDCAELMREGVQYYHRYISFWHTSRYELCARDTKRNLKLFAFVREHAKYDRDKLQFDQWRPYVTMMHARAVGTPLVELQQWDAAIGAIDAAIRGIKQFLADYGQEEQADKMGELAFLRRWRKEVAKAASSDKDKPVIAGLADEDTSEEDPVERVQAELAAAVEEERYEDAARLRDELRRLEEPPPPTSMGGGPA